MGVTLTPHDAFPGDDHAELELPSQPTLPVTVYSNEPDLLRPLLGAAPRVHAVYRKPEEYRPNDPGLVIIDRFTPAQRPAGDSIWIEPSAQGSPIPVRRTVEQAAFQGWNAGHPAAAGLRAKDFKLDKVSVFEAAAGVTQIGRIEAGPVIVAREGKPRVVVFGFHPALSAMRYELTAPLLFANLLRWFAPEIFRRWEINGGSVGSVKVVMERDVPANEVKVTGENGAQLPFSYHDRTLNFFSGTPGPVRVVAGDREYLYSLTLPQLWDSRWEPPAEAPKAMPRFSPALDSSTEVWPWLAIAGTLGLIAEWFLYGSFRRSLRMRPVLLRRRQAEMPGVRR
jgi:hypothetical protein